MAQWCRAHKGIRRDIRREQRAGATAPHGAWTPAGNITGRDIQTGSLQVTMSGIGKLTLSGAGIYDASDLASNTARVLVSGAGSARVKVRDTLDATVPGVGSIVYFGDPTVTQHVTGADSVRKG